MMNRDSAYRAYDACPPERKLAAEGARQGNSLNHTPDTRFETASGCLQSKAFTRNSDDTGRKTMGLMINKKLGFGTMRLPLIDPENPRSVDLEQFIRMVDLYLAKGFCYFDTAYPYHGE